MRSRVLSWLAAHNPFYLLSALCMLFGCYTLQGALALKPGQVGKQLALLVTLNVYEGLLIWLALFLIARRGLERDGKLLLLLEVPFLCDATLLSGESFAADLRIGAAVSLAALLLAFLKVAAVVRALDRGAWARAAPLALPLVLLFATPGIFASLAASRLLGMGTAYAVYWAIALAIVQQAALERRLRAGDAGPEHAVSAAFRRALAFGLPASLVLHAVASGWVQQVPFRPAHLSPVLLAAGAARILLEAEWPSPRWRVGLPVAAIVLSLAQPEELLFEGPLGMLVSPLRCVLLMAGLVWLLAYQMHRLRAFAAGAAVCLPAAAAGHSVTAILDRGAQVVRWFTQGGGRMLPRTAEDWGVVAVAVAFVLLGLGAWTSMLGPRGETPSARDSRST